MNRRSVAQAKRELQIIEGQIVHNNALRGKLQEEKVQVEKEIREYYVPVGDPFSVGTVLTWNKDGYMTQMAIKERNGWHIRGHKHIRPWDSMRQVLMLSTVDQDSIKVYTGGCSMEFFLSLGEAVDPHPPEPTVNGEDYTMIAVDADGESVSYRWNHVTRRWIELVDKP